MVRWGNSGSSRWLATGVSAILALGFATPTSVWAECGNYVHTGNNAGPMMVQQSATPRDTAQNANPDSPAPSPGHLPCRGPTCSRGGIPPAAPLPSLTTTLQEWAWLHFTPERPLADPSSFLLVNPSARPVRRAAGIFHPPRFVL